MTSPEPFGKLRSFFWPIYAHEFKKLGPLLLISFLLSFNYNILKATKDALIVTSSACGVEAIQFIKMGLIFPLSVFFVYIFARMSQRLDREKRLHAIAVIFLGYFALFAFVLFPARDQLNLDSLAATLKENWSRGHYGWIETLHHWHYSTFYTMSELWGTIVLNVGFWSYVNEVTPVEEAKRFYPVLGICLNVSGVAAGMIGNFFDTSLKPAKDVTGEHWELVLMWTMGAVLASGVAALLVFHRFHRKFGAEETTQATVGQSKKKIKTSLTEDFILLLRSPYILALTMTIFAFGFVINSTELLWKDYAKQLYITTADYFRLSNNFNIFTGLLATPMAIVAGWSIRRLGWTFSALLPPILFGVTSLGFFSYLLLPGPFASFSELLHATPARLAFFFGASLTVLSRMIKYTLYDATKELAFIPLDRKTKLQGKAAIDGIGSRMGKLGSSAFLTLAFLLVNPADFSERGVTLFAPQIMIACFTLLGLWALSVVYLGRQFSKLTLADSRDKP